MPAVELLIDNQIPSQDGSDPVVINVRRGGTSRTVTCVARQDTPGYFCNEGNYAVPLSADRVRLSLDGNTWGEWGAQLEIGDISPSATFYAQFKSLAGDVGATLALPGEIFIDYKYPRTISGVVSAVSSISCDAVAQYFVSGQVNAISGVSCAAYLSGYAFGQVNAVSGVNCDAAVRATFAPTNDGIVRSSSTSWATARAATSGTATYTVDATGDMGAAFLNVANYYIDRAVMAFDTSSIPDGATIISATLRLYKYAMDGTGDTVHVITTSLPGITGVSDFNATNFGTVSAGSITNPADGYNDISLDLGVISINKTGNTSLGFRSARDLNDTVPTGFDRLRWYLSETEGTSLDPQLVVVFS